MTSVAFRDENCPSASPDRGACDGRAKKTVLLRGLSVRSEPSVRPESLTDSSPPSPPPSPCPRARPLVPSSPRPLATTDTLPRSALFLPMQIKYPPPTTLTGLRGCQKAPRRLASAQAGKKRFSPRRTSAEAKQANLERRDKLAKVQYFNCCLASMRAPRESPSGPER